MIDKYEILDCEPNEIEIKDQTDKDFEFTERKNDSTKLISDSSVLLNEITRSPIITSALDRIRVTNGAFNILAGAIGNVLKANPSETRLSVSTNRRRRIANRKPIIKSIKDNFISKFTLKRFIVHWDGKLLTDTTNSNKKMRKRKVDRLAVVVTGNGEYQPLGCPKIDSGTGRKIAHDAFGEIQKWDLSDKVILVLKMVLVLFLKGNI